MLQWGEFFSLSCSECTGQAEGVCGFPVEKQAENQRLRDWNYWFGCDVRRELSG